MIKIQTWISLDTNLLSVSTSLTADPIEGYLQDYCDRVKGSTLIHHLDDKNVHLQSDLLYSPNQSEHELFTDFHEKVINCKDLNLDKF